MDNILEKTPPEALRSTQEIVRHCLLLHEQVDTILLQQSNDHLPAFHNQDHVQATIDAATLLVEAAHNSNDPLHLLDDLKTWNTLHPEAAIDEPDLLKVVQLAFACHDLGNILSEKNTTEELHQITPKHKPNYLPHYTATGAEDRSRVLATKLGIKKQFIPLIQHLIDQTKPESAQIDKKLPFSQFARVVDQLGNQIFNKNRAYPAGLIAEDLKEGKPRPETYNPIFMLNFNNRNHSNLISPEVHAKILEIWQVLPPQKIVPPKKYKLIDEPMDLGKLLPLMRTYLKDHPIPKPSPTAAKVPA